MLQVFIKHATRAKLHMAHWVLKANYCLKMMLQSFNMQLITVYNIRPLLKKKQICKGKALEIALYFCIILTLPFLFITFCHIRSTDTWRLGYSHCLPTHVSMYSGNSCRSDYNSMQHSLLSQATLTKSTKIGMSTKKIFLLLKYYRTPRNRLIEFRLWISITIMVVFNYSVDSVQNPTKNFSTLFFRPVKRTPDVDQKGRKDSVWCLVLMWSSLRNYIYLNTNIC